MGVELKATGTQVAIPPTPGYSWANETWEPLYGGLADIWSEIATTLGVTFDTTKAGRGGAGYPSAFQSRVAKGERNNAIFIESCRLAESGVPFEKALTFMIKRVMASYDQGGLNQREIDRTVRSAYKHVGKAVR